MNSTNKGQLTEKDHGDMDKFFEKVLLQVRDGQLEISDAVADLAQVAAALDLGDIGSARGFWKNYEGIKRVTRPS